MFVVQAAHKAVMPKSWVVHAAGVHVHASAFRHKGSIAVVVVEPMEEVIKKKLQSVCVVLTLMR